MNMKSGYAPRVKLFWKSLFINLYWHFFKIDFNSANREKITQALFDLMHCNDEGCLRQWYHTYYTNYSHDAVVRDWMPSLWTMLVKQSDDCDGMAVLGAEILKQHLIIISRRRQMDPSEYKVAVFGFVTPNEGHAMAVAWNPRTGKHFLFDYGEITEHDGEEQVRERFRTKYQIPYPVSSIRAHRLRQLPPPLSFI